MIDLTKKYTMDELASLYAHTNCWEWPTEVLGPKPWYWEEARKTNAVRRMRNCKRFTKFFDKLVKIVPRELQVRAWWTEILGRTEKECWAWWNDTGKYFNF